VISSRPNLLFLLDTLVYELNQIQIANGPGNYVNVRQVLTPDFPPNDMDRVWGVPETPALLVWLLSLGHGRNPNTIQDVYVNARVEIVGVVKAKEGVQYLAAALCESVRRVMLSNPYRVHPNLTAAPPFVGVGTFEDPRGTAFEVSNLEESVSACAFGSTWNLEYQFPITTG